jgi:radical SAM/Cys-rich protein
MKLKTLQRLGNELASPARQLEVLGDVDRIAAGRFEAALAAAGHGALRSADLQTLQINVGRVCNQTCSHCHVDAGPDRRESMSRQTAEQIIEFLKHSAVQTLDITGGAPEMNPNFRWIVEQATALGRHVIDRCNLTILLAAGFTDLPEFLAEHRVEVVASLPCYLEANCDAQRGSGVFAKSIQAIERLNDLGYGQPGSDLCLNLVFNPVGTGLPPPQPDLEQTYRDQLWERYGLKFNRLLTITNMPISRYLDDLSQRGQYLTYMEKLISRFNPATIGGLMCVSYLSVDWQGYLYDCDFNQMLGLRIDAARGQHITEVTPAELLGRQIQTANHCFGCTAGCGSGCQGSVL